LLKEKTTYLLQSALLGLFDSADDTLFELADKSDNNQDQTLYFESMRQVRLCRRDIEARFIEYIHDSFDALADPAPKSQDEWDYEFDMDNLSLLNNDQLEQNVAIEAMVNKAVETAPESLQHLTLRLDSLVPAKVYQRNNPVGPHEICVSFLRACEKLDTNIKIKLVLLKLFDRHVVSELSGFYDLANDLMISRNILPSLKTDRQQRSPINRGPSEATSNGRRPASHQTSAGLQKEVLETFRSLVAQNPGVAPTMPQQPGYGTVERHDGFNSGMEVSEAALLQLLTQMQIQQMQVSNPGVGIDIQQLQSLVNTRHQGIIGQLDRDVISLINLLFEFIVEDRNLAAEMKALLSRLQIPLLKVAIADKTFFDHSGHPAKRLLNEMATAALGWVPNQTGRDNLFGRIEQTVKRICQDPNVNIEVFDEMLMEFLSFIDKEKKQAAILEKRTLDAEAGKAKAESARAQVTDELSKLKDVDKLSANMHKLVHEAWANVMFLIALKDGVDSPQWNSAHSTVRNLVWSLTVEVTSLNRVRLVKLLPELLKRLRSGLESIGYNAYDMGKLFKDLEAEHLTQLRSKPIADGEPVAPVPSSEPVARDSYIDLNAPSSNPGVAASAAVNDFAGKLRRSVAADDQGDIIVDLTDEAKMPDEQKARPAPEAPAAKVVVEPPAAAAPPILEAEPEPALLEPEPQFLDQVDSLSQGSWFELRNGETTIRCRLAAIIKPVGKYIFVNRSGMKVAEKERRDLALNLRSGEIRMLDNSMLFDRALESVISNLRESRGLDR